MKALTILLTVFLSISLAYADKCYSGDCYDGKGMMIYDQGSSYIGEWKNGVPDGSGIMTFSNGLTFYMGNWKNGLPHGKGVMMDRFGSLIHVGFFKNGIPNGR